MRTKRLKIRRKIHPVQPAHRLAGGSVVMRKYGVEGDLRQLAKGRECQVRLPGCDGGFETTILAHYRMTPYCGIGAKPNDFVFGAWCCAHCHDAADFRIRSTLSRIEVAYAHMQGILRTQMALIELGLVNL